MSRIFEALKRVESQRALPALRDPAGGPSGFLRSRPATQPYQHLAHSIMRAGAPGTSRVLLVVSAVPGEGSSTVARSLALTLGRDYGGRVLLLDADLRGPAQHHAFGVERSGGLTEVVRGFLPLEKALSNGYAPGLSLMTSGRPTENPTELLNATVVRDSLNELRKLFDWIVIDGAPATTYSDSLILGPLTDGAVLVVHAESTKWQVVNRARRALEEAGTQVLGAVLNRRKYHIPNWLYRWS